MRPQVITLTTLTNDANGIFQDQTTSGAATLTLNGALVSSGVAYCYGASSNLTTHQAQLIAIEGTGNNSGVVATITGTGPGNEVVVEALTLANSGTATSSYYFKTVSSITVDGAVTGNIEGGWLSSSTDPAVTLAFKMDYTSAAPILLDVQIPSGTLTCTVQYTFNMPQDDYGTVGFDNSAVWEDTDGMAGISATTPGNLIAGIQAVRLEVNTWTSGTPTLTANQGRMSY